MKKRLTALLLALVMAFTGMSVTAFAADDYDERPTFDVDDDGILIGYFGDSSSVTIPSTVKKIDNFVFSGKTFIKSVSIPSSCTEIGYCAFSGCTGITNVSFPSTLTYLGDSAFTGCTSLKTVKIPSSVTNMGIGVFEFCTSLTSATLPTQLTELPEATFSGCTALTSYTVASNFTSIGFMAFDGCSSLSKIVMPSTVTTIGLEAFDGCSSLKNVTMCEALIKDNYMYFSNYEDISFTVAETGKTVVVDEINDTPVVVDDDEVPVIEDDAPKFVKNATYNNNFVDVASSDWFYSNVISAYEYGFVSGRDANKYAPTGTITVAEAIVIAVRMHCIYYSKELPGVSSTSKWYDSYVSYAMAVGIMDYGDFSSYDKAATRADMATLFVNALPASVYEEINSDISIPDVAVNASFCNAVTVLYHAGITVGGDARGNYYPTKSIQRSEVAAIISRIADTTLRITIE